jgi:hypothetical protein
MKRQMTEVQRQQVIAEDHRLEEASELSGWNLAKHRWHWTMDVSNPDRWESVRAYAEAIGRTQPTVRVYVTAYEIYLDKSERVNLSPVKFTEFLIMASASQDRQNAIAAISEARGIGIAATQRLHREDIKIVKDAVDEFVTEHPGATPQQKQEKANTVAKMIKVRETYDTKRQDLLSANKPILLTVLLGHAHKAKAELLEMVEHAQEFDVSIEENYELLTTLQEALGKIVDAVEMVKRALAGEEAIDWNAELAKLREE